MKEQLTDNTLKKTVSKVDTQEDGACSYISIGLIRNTTKTDNKISEISVIEAYDISESTDADNNIERDLFPQEYLCSICDYLLIQATRLPCRHIYCFYCIQKSLIQKPRCPECRALVVSFETDKNIDATIEALVSDYPDIKSIRETRACRRFKDPELSHLTKSKSSVTESAGGMEAFAFITPTNERFNRTSSKMGETSETEVSITIDNSKIRDDELSNSSNEEPDEDSALDELPTYAEAIVLTKKT